MMMTFPPMTMMSLKILTQVTLNLPGDFMQADMDTLVHVRFVGKMVEL
jgi:hypothetical protein